MIDFSPQEFDSLTFNVQKHPRGTDLYKKFPILSKFASFKIAIGDLSPEVILRYGDIGI